MKVLTRRRLELGWSKAELARRAGLHPSQIGQFESGRVQPYRGQLLKLAVALGVPENQAHRLLHEDFRKDRDGDSDRQGVKE